MSVPDAVRRLSFEAVFAGVALYATTPLWSVTHPPIQDLPQHLAAVRVLADYNDPDLAFAQYFTIELGRTQYLAYYLAAIVLSWFVGVLVANKLLIAISIVATPYSLRALLAQIGADPRTALFAVPLTWNAHLILGFMNFTAAIPLAFLGLALAVSLRRRWSLRRAVALGAVTLICFYTHVVPFAFLGLGAALVALDVRDWRSTLRGWLPLGPSVIAMAIWSQMSPAGQSTVSAASSEAAFAPPMQNVAELPGWLTDVLLSDRDGELLVAYGLVFLVAMVAGSRAEAGSPRRIVAMLAPVAALLYFVTPVSYQWIWPINARFPLLALLFLITALPRQRGWVGAFTLSAVITISVASTHEVDRAFMAYERNEVGALDEAIAAMPHGARVAGLVFDRGSREVKFSPFIHSAAWVQAENGGAVMFTFADFPQSPFVFRPDNRPPPVGPRWEWMPERVEPARDLGWYDYVLVRGGPGRIARDPRFERVFEDAPWSVYRQLR